MKTKGMLFSAHQCVGTVVLRTLSFIILSPCPLSHTLASFSALLFSIGYSDYNAGFDKLFQLCDSDRNEFRLLKIDVLEREQLWSCYSIFCVAVAIVLYSESV